MAPTVHASYRKLRADEVVASLQGQAPLESRAESPSQRAGTLRFLITGILINFGMGPILIAASWIYTTCQGGAPAWCYYVLACQILHCFHEASAVTAQKPLVAWKMPEHPGDVTPADYLHRGYQVTLEAFNEAPLVGSGGVVPLVLVGFLDVVDLSTDLLLPGQAKSCDSSADQVFYLKTWNDWGIVQDFLRTVHLSGALLIFISSVMLVQLFMASWAVYRARGIAKIERAYDLKLPGGREQAEELCLCYKNIAYASASFGGCWLEKIYTEAAKRVPGDDPNLWQEISETVNGEMVARASIKKLDMQDPEIKSNIEARQKAAKDWVVYHSVITRVLAEAAPALLFAIAMFDLSFDQMAFPSKVKTIATLVTSLATCFVKAVQCFRMGDWRASLVGIAILCFICVTCVKLHYAFQCTDHFFNLFGWHCVERDSRL